MSSDTIHVAMKLLDHGASARLVAHITRLKKQFVESMTPGASGGPAALKPEQIDAFLRLYGDPDHLTVDVNRFIAAIERSGLPPDPAFQALRQIMWQKILERLEEQGGPLPR